MWPGLLACRVAARGSRAAVWAACARSSHWWCVCGVHRAGEGVGVIVSSCLGCSDKACTFLYPRLKLHASLLLLKHLAASIPEPSAEQRPTEQQHQQVAVLFSILYFSVKLGWQDSVALWTVCRIRLCIPARRLALFKVFSLGLMPWSSGEHSKPGAGEKGEDEASAAVHACGDSARRAATLPGRRWWHDEDVPHAQEGDGAHGVVRSWWACESPSAMFGNCHDFYEYHVPHVHEHTVLSRWDSTIMLVRSAQQPC